MESREILIESALERLLKIGDLPKAELLPHLDLRSLLRLSQTNRAIHGFFEEGPCREAVLDILMAHFAHIIVNEPTAENISALKLLLTNTNILDAYPELLTRKINRVVFEETGQAYINYSLLQLAFAEGDDELCCDVFDPLFERVFKSKEAARAKMREQLDEKFPEESDEETQQREATEISQLAELLAPVKQAVTNEQFNNGEDEANKLILNPATHAEIITFREKFDALQPKEIHKGGRFSLNTLLIIYEDYEQAAPLWQYEYNPCALYEDAVISQAQRYMPKNDAMRCSQGLYNLQGGAKSFARDTILQTGPQPRLNFYLCLRQLSRDFSGLVGACVDIIFGLGPRTSRILCTIRPPIYQNSCRTKTSNLQSLRGQTKNVLRAGL